VAEAPELFSWPGAQARALAEPLFSWPGALALAPGALSLPALTQFDWREGALAEAPVASVLELELELRELPADGLVELELDDGPLAELLADGLGSLPALGELWANAPVAAPAARAATAQSVVILRIWDSSLAPQLAQQLAGARSVHRRPISFAAGEDRKMPCCSTS